MNSKVLVVVPIVVLVALGAVLGGVFTNPYDQITSCMYTIDGNSHSLDVDYYPRMSKFLIDGDKKSIDAQLTVPSDPEVVFSVVLEDGTKLERKLYDDASNDRVIVQKEDATAYALPYDDAKLRQLVDNASFKTALDTYRPLLAHTYLTFDEHRTELVSKQVDMSTYVMGDGETDSATDENAMAFLTFVLAQLSFA